MNKKSLLSLLVVPLLLAGCAGSKGPGERGEDVLTAEQKERYLATEVNDYTVENKKLADFKINLTEYPHKYTDTDVYPFLIYDKGTAGTEANEWKIYSVYAGEIATLTKPEGATTIVGFHTGTLNLLESSDGVKGLLYYATFEKDDQIISYNAVVDMFGNVIWKSAKPVSEESFANGGWLKPTDPVTGEVTYVVDLYIRDNVHNIISKHRVAYGENFRGLTAYTPTGTSTDLGTYKFTHKEVEYTVGMTAGREYYVSHVNKKEETETQYFQVPSNNVVAATLIGEYLLYQRQIEVNLHEEEYTYTTAEHAYKLVTERLNLVDLKTEEIEFPYYINSLSYQIFLDKDAKPTDPVVIPQYSVAKLTKIIDKHKEAYSERYVIDADLVLHDDLTALSTGLKKFGESHYYDPNNDVILDNNYNFVTGIGDYTIVNNGQYAKCMIVRKDGKYGAIDETGKVIVPVAYSTLDNASSGNLVIFTKGDSGHPDKVEVLYFNPYTLKAENRVLNSEKSYALANDYFYFERGVLNPDTAEYSDNYFYFYNTKIATYKYFTNEPLYKLPAIVSYNKNTLRYNVVTFETDEGELGVLSALSAKTYVK